MAPHVDRCAYCALLLYNIRATLRSPLQLRHVRNPPIVLSSATTSGFGDIIASTHLQERSSIGVYWRLKIPWIFLLLACLLWPRHRVYYYYPPTPLFPVGVGSSVTPVYVPLYRLPADCSPLSPPGRPCCAVSVYQALHFSSVVCVALGAKVGCWVRWHEASAPYILDIWVCVGWSFILSSKLGAISNSVWYSLSLSRSVHPGLTRPCLSCPALSCPVLSCLSFSFSVLLDFPPLFWLLCSQSMQLAVRAGSVTIIYHLRNHPTARRIK